MGIAISHETQIFAFKYNGLLDSKLSQGELCNAMLSLGVWNDTKELNFWVPWIFTAYWISSCATKVIPVMVILDTK